MFGVKPLGLSALKHSSVLEHVSVDWENLLNIIILNNEGDNWSRTARYCESATSEITFYESVVPKGFCCRKEMLFVVVENSATS
jgi:hypothetical protein